MSKRKIGRREFLRLSALAAGAAAVASCTPAPAPTPGVPAAKPTAGTVATPAPAAAPAAPANAPDQKVGKNLIGKLEGPEVITDVAKYPKAFKEAPQLAELVKAGKLPSVEKRLPEEPLVIKPLKETGKYGGNWRRGFTGPADFWNGLRAASGPDHILFWDYTGETVVPNLAKGWKVSDDGKSTTVYLRKGMKWSDGEPFTADDFVFWFEDVYGNKDLVPVPSWAMQTSTGKSGSLKKVDDYTVVFEFPEPYYLLPDVLAGSTPLGGLCYQGNLGLGGFAPKHYLKQFLPKYTPQADLDKMAKDNKFENWVLLYKFKASWNLNPDLPVVSPWKTTSPANTPTWTLERNPYSIWVDTDGNQLPYIDKMTMTLGENLEVINLRAIAGEYDFQARHMDLAKLPVFLENQQKGNYKVYLDPADYGADMAIKFNLSYEADPEIGKWLGNTDFRRALSLGIDRDQLNETFWLGTGTPSSVVPADTNKYNPGAEYRTLWATLDLKKSNEMLDKIGLDKKDGEGYRLRTDGKGRLRLEFCAPAGMFLPFAQIAEMIKQQWKKIGIDLNVTEMERSLATSRGAANELQLSTWNNDGSEHIFTFPNQVFPYNNAEPATSGPLYATWFNSFGAQGKEPPARMKELMDKWRKAFAVPEKEKIQLGKEVWKIAADEVYIIGTVGLGPASMGVRIVKNNMGNIPGRQYCSPDGATPAISRTMTFFFK
ncbi:MAG TPA: ABC transporter substrate-binding protein [Chloroflexota bacterium]